MPQIKLTLKEREIIAQYVYLGKKTEEIAEFLGRHRTTIERELKRNKSDDGEYFPVEAHRMSFYRKSAVHSGRKKIQENRALNDKICELLREEYWSPDIISGRLHQFYPDDQNMWISTQSIYNLIRSDQAQGGMLYKYLNYGKKGYHKRNESKGVRGQIPDRVMIDERPDVVNKLERFGDWESDTIVGKAHKGFIASHVERKSKYTLLAKLSDKRSDTFNKASIKAFRRVQKKISLPLHTLTTDNGKEFSGHKFLAEMLNVDVYFAHPFCSWERGRNENMNRMVRQWFPKGTDFRTICEDDVLRVEYLLNNRPRKSLGYRTPTEVLNESLT